MHLLGYSCIEFLALKTKIALNVIEYRKLLKFSKRWTKITVNFSEKKIYICI